jgi:hypothetical protein
MTPRPLPRKSNLPYLKNKLKENCCECGYSGRELTQKVKTLDSNLSIEIKGKNGKASRISTNVKYELWVVIMCHHLSISCTKGAIVVIEVYEIFLCLLVNFVINPKLL